MWSDNSSSVAPRSRSHLSPARMRRRAASDGLIPKPVAYWSTASLRLCLTRRFNGTSVGSQSLQLSRKLIWWTTPPETLITCLGSTSIFSRSADLPSPTASQEILQRKAKTFVINQGRSSGDSTIPVQVPMDRRNGQTRQFCNPCGSQSGFILIKGQCIHGATLATWQKKSQAKSSTKTKIMWHILVKRKRSIYNAKTTGSTLSGIC